MPFIPPEELDEEGEAKPKSDILKIGSIGLRNTRHPQCPQVSGQRFLLGPVLALFPGFPGRASFKMAGRHSIVEYFGDSGGHRCGYCKSSSTNHSHGK